MTVAVLVAASAAVLFLVFIVIQYLYSHNPAISPSPKCLFKVLTGYDCPGCGSQRALYAIAHGRLSEAWHLNKFIFFAVPAGAFYLYIESTRTRHPRLHARAVHPAILTAILVAVISYWIGRNLF